MKREQQAKADDQILQDHLKENDIQAQRTDEGIYYNLSETGEGDQPSLSDTVTVHYAGRLLDGTPFDSSYSRNAPATFPLRALIEGWQIAIPMLKRGGKGTFYIPSGLAYGARGAGASIPGNANLIFDIELLDF